MSVCVHVHTCIFLGVFQVRIRWVSYYAGDIFKLKESPSVPLLAKIRGNAHVWSSVVSFRPRWVHQKVTEVLLSFWEGILTWNVEGYNCFLRVWVCEVVCSSRRFGWEGCLSEGGTNLQRRPKRWRGELTSDAILGFLNCFIPGSHY